MLMSPNKDETAVHGCHCQGDMAVRMRKVLAISRSWQSRPQSRVPFGQRHGTKALAMSNEIPVLIG